MTGFGKLKTFFIGSLRFGLSFIKRGWRDPELWAVELILVAHCTYLLQCATNINWFFAQSVHFRRLTFPILQEAWEDTCRRQTLQMLTLSESIQWQHQHEGPYKVGFVLFSIYPLFPPLRFPLLYFLCLHGSAFRIHALRAYAVSYLTELTGYSLDPNPNPIQDSHGWEAVPLYNLRQRIQSLKLLEGMFFLFKLNPSNTWKLLKILRKL